MKTRNGFTLVEMLVVITMIGLLMAVLSGALYKARMTARKTRAEVQLRELLTAWGEFILIEPIFGSAARSLPSGMDGVNGLPMDKETMELLTEPNSQGYVYLNLSDAQFKNGYYVDPWHNPYYVKLNKADEVTEDKAPPGVRIIKASVNLVNRNRE